MRRAEGGGADPVSASRASKRTASGSIAAIALGDMGEALAAAALFEMRGEIGSDAGHALRAQRLDPRLLDALEHLARLVGRGAALGMHRVVVIAQPQRRGVGGAAQLRRLFLPQLAAGQRQAHARAADRRQLGAVDDVDVLALGDRPHRGGSRALEDLDGGFGFGHSDARIRIRYQTSGADARLLELGAEAALVVFGDGRALHLVALVEEGETEGEGEDR